MACQHPCSLLVQMFVTSGKKKKKRKKKKSNAIPVTGNEGP
jgi:hypothetical protein